MWGAPPGSWPGLNANSGAVTFGSGPPVPQYPVQYGFLTDQMIKVGGRSLASKHKQILNEYGSEYYQRTY